MSERVCALKSLDIICRLLFDADGAVLLPYFKGLLSGIRGESVVASLFDDVRSMIDATNFKRIVTIALLTFMKDF